MLITYSADSTNPQFNGNEQAQAVTAVVTAVNNAIKQRIAATGDVSNVQNLAIFGDLDSAKMLNQGESDQLKFTELNFNFRKSKDVSHLYPLQGIQGTTGSGVRRTVGDVSSSLQTVNFALSEFSVISEIGTFYSVALEQASHKKYGTRILGFYISGTVGGTEKLQLYLPENCGRLEPLKTLKPDGDGEEKLTVDNLEKKLLGINTEEKTHYQVGIFKSPMYLKLRGGEPAKTWRELLNVAVTIFKGKSSNYINGLGFATSVTPEGVLIDNSTATAVSFALDFEKIDFAQVGGASDYGTYEMSFQATNTSRNLLIDQQGSDFTWSIPSVGAFGFMVGSPFSYTKRKTKTKESEETGSRQIIEKAVYKLPQTFYQLVNIASTPLDNVQAAILVTYTNGKKSKITVPLEKKLLLVNSEEAVAKAVIAAI